MESNNWNYFMYNDLVDFVDNTVYNEFNETIYPEWLVERMKELKLFWLNIPRNYWWLGYSIKEQAQIVRLLAKGSISLTGLLWSHLKVCNYILNYWTEKQKEFLYQAAVWEVIYAHAFTEPGGKPPVENMTTIIKRSNWWYVLSWTKTFVTNWLHSDYIAVVAKYDHHKSIALVKNREQWISHGPERRRIWFKGVSLCPIYFDDLIISEDDILWGVHFDAQEMENSVSINTLVNYCARWVGLVDAVSEELQKYFAIKNNKMNSILLESKQIYDSIFYQLENTTFSLNNAYFAKKELTNLALKCAELALILWWPKAATSDFKIERYLRDAVALQLIWTPNNKIESILSR